ncbi:unnamed protein product [Amoebophrya sp. A120]|nr:unnamed protein product [Amoebophrya sp. A120]|eukprot:GSA120T00021638001.1
MAVLLRRSRILRVSAKRGLPKVHPSTGLVLKKGKGQHILHNEGVLDVILEAASLRPGVDTVLEVGPGTGVLTLKLLEHAKSVVAIDVEKAMLREVKFRAESAGLLRSLVAPYASSPGERETETETHHDATSSATSSSDPKKGLALSARSRASGEVDHMFVVEEDCDDAAAPFAPSLMPSWSSGLAGEQVGGELDLDHDTGKEPQAATQRAQELLPSDSRATLFPTVHRKTKKIRKKRGVLDEEEDDGEIGTEHLGTTSWIPQEQRNPEGAKKKKKLAQCMYPEELHRDMNLRLYHGDVLDQRVQQPFDVCVANLPYKISTKFVYWLFGLLGSPTSRWKRAVLMFQAEFAERLLADPGEHKFNRLSMNARLFVKTEKIMDVKAGSFIPQPQVKSTIVRLTPRKEFLCAVSSTTPSRSSSGWPLMPLAAGSACFPSQNIGGGSVQRSSAGPGPPLSEEEDEEQRGTEHRPADSTGIHFAQQGNNASTVSFVEWNTFMKIIFQRRKRSLNATFRLRCVQNLLEENFRQYCSQSGGDRPLRMIGRTVRDICLERMGEKLAGRCAAELDSRVLLRLLRDLHLHGIFFHPATVTAAASESRNSRRTSHAADADFGSSGNSDSADPTETRSAVNEATSNAESELPATHAIGAKVMHFHDKSSLSSEPPASSICTSDEENTEDWYSYKSSCRTGDGEISSTENLKTSFSYRGGCRASPN